MLFNKSIRISTIFFCFPKAHITTPARIIMRVCDRQSNPKFLMFHSCVDLQQQTEDLQNMHACMGVWKQYLLGAEGMTILVVIICPGDSGQHGHAEGASSQQTCDGEEGHHGQRNENGTEEDEDGSGQHRGNGSPRDGQPSQQQQQTTYRQ